MSRADDPRTAKDLAARGYRLVCQGRMRDYRNGGYTPPSYSLRKIGDDDRWVGLVEGVPSERGLAQARSGRSYGRQTAQTFTARGLTKRGEIAARPLGTGFRTTVEAAHAIVDAIEGPARAGCDALIPQHDYEAIGDGNYRCSACGKEIHLEVVPIYPSRPGLTTFLALALTLLLALPTVAMAAPRPHRHHHHRTACTHRRRRHARPCRRRRPVRTAPAAPVRTAPAAVVLPPPAILGVGSAPGCVHGADPTPALSSYPVQVLRVLVNSTYGGDGQELPCAAAAIAAGYRVHLDIQYWNSSTPDEVVAFFRKVLDEYSSIPLWAVSVGNEQEIQPSAVETGAQYAAIWRLVEPIIAAAAPGAILVAGEISPWGVPWLADAVAAGLPGAQALAGHPYALPHGFAAGAFVAWCRSLGLQAWFTEGLDLGPGTWGRPTDLPAQMMPGASVAYAWLA